MYDLHPQLHAPAKLASAHAGPQPCTASFRSRMLRYVFKPTLCSGYSQTFSEQRASWGSPEYMTWEKVKAPESGFLDDKKCCCVAVQITAQASTQAVDCACLTDHD